MPHPVIDPQAIENLRMLNPDDGDAFLREIAEIFLADTPKRIEELDQTLAAGDAVIFMSSGSFSGAASKTKLVPVIAGAIWSNAEMRWSRAGSPLRSARALSSRVLNESSQSLDGS